MTTAIGACGTDQAEVRGGENVKRPLFLDLILLVFLLIACTRAAAQPTPMPAIATCPAERPVKEIRIIQENGGRVAWSPDGEFVVFDRENADGYFDLFVMTPSGEIVASLTDGNSHIHQRHNGNPNWHPSGKYIVFQSEETDHYRASDQWPGNPGIGVYANLWAVTPDGSRFWQLTDIPIKQTLTDGITAFGSLNPHFNHDGTRLVWTERYADGGRWGRWRLKIADFIADGAGPRLENERVLLESTETMGAYVTLMDFSPDESQFLLAGNLEGQDEFGMDQYLYDPQTGAWTNLHNTPDIWEEDASWSPDGKSIVYMTNIGSPVDFNDPDWYWQKTRREYWIMSADGTDKRPLTCFNVPGAPEYIPQGAIIAASAFNPDGRFLAGILGVDYGTADKADFQLKIVLIEFK